jgi:hypothetical protein
LIAFYVLSTADKMVNKKTLLVWLARVVHTCNSSYVEGGDEDDNDSRPDTTKS